MALNADQVATFFLTTPLFAGLERPVIDKIAPHAKLMSYTAGQVIIRAGEAAQSLGLVYKGSVSVRAQDGDAATREVLHQGDHFGEEAILLKSPEPFSIVAEEATSVLLLPREVVDALFEKIPAFVRTVARLESERLITATNAAQRPSRAAAPAPPSAPAAARAGATPAMPGSGGVIPFVLVSDFEPTSQLVALVPTRVIHQSQLLPLKLTGNVLTVGMVHPRNGSAVLEAHRFLSTMQLEVVAIAADDFEQALKRLRISATDTAKGPLAPETLQFDQVEVEPEKDRSARGIGDDVVLMVSRIVAAALDKEASDIHIEPEAHNVRVRYRVNGLLTDWGNAVPPNLARGIVARLKVLAGLDITERRLPQDGRIGLHIGRRDIDLRVSTLPSSRGETIVARVLEAATVLRPLENVFVDPQTLAAARRALNRPNGAIVVAGPTGSGKTATLYAMLSERKTTRPDSNVVMVEDPVEYRLSGATQVQVNHNVGVTFARVLRAMLRQDPDVIMVGEVRDQETAMLAVEAAMTGHLLFTSIHANDAVSVVQRLENLGCNRMHVAQALALVVVQRLAPRLCERCVKPELASPVLVDSLVAHGLWAGARNDVKLPQASGCQACNNSGFVGRIAVIESLHVTDELRAALMAGKSLNEVRQFALNEKLLTTFQQAAGGMLKRNLIGPSDALLTVGS